MSVAAAGEAPELTRKRQLQALIDTVRDAMRGELARREIAVAIPEDLGCCELRRDAFDGSETFYGEWHDTAGRCCGNITAHAGGQFFAELDVLLAHPGDRRWFVEAVTAWGRADIVKTELRLLPALAG